MKMKQTKKEIKKPVGFWKRYNAQITKDNRDDLERCIMAKMNINYINEISGIDKDLILEFAMQSKQRLEEMKYKKNRNISLGKIMGYKHFIQENKKEI